MGPTDSAALEGFLGSDHLSLTQEPTVVCAWAGGGISGGEPPLLTHIVSFEISLTVTGLWGPNRER